MTTIYMLYNVSHKISFQSVAEVVIVCQQWSGNIRWGNLMFCCGLVGTSEQNHAVKKWE